MKKYLFPLLLCAILAALLFSCSQSKVITGNIEGINGDTAKVSSHRFKVLKNLPKLNQYCTFTPTKDSSKVNCVKLK